MHSSAPSFFFPPALHFIYCSGTCTAHCTCQLLGSQRVISCRQAAAHTLGCLWSLHKEVEGVKRSAVHRALEARGNRQPGLMDWKARGHSKLNSQVGRPGGTSNKGDESAWGKGWEAGLGPAHGARHIRGRSVNSNKLGWGLSGAAWTLQEPVLCQASSQESTGGSQGWG